MPTPQNTIVTDDVVRVLDIDFITQFEQGVTGLLEVLGIAEPRILAAGTQIKQYAITGVLQNGSVDEGADIPLSHYEQELVATYTVDLQEYRKATSAQAILKSGFETAVTSTDAKFIRQIQGKIRTAFFGFLADGTNVNYATGFQAAFAKAWGVLANEMSAQDTDGTPVFFANPLDLADYLGSAQLYNVEAAFGFTYIKNFLGLGTCVFDAMVPRGVVYATPAENINCYGIDLSELGRAGLSFEVSDETGLIGVHHTGRYQNGTAETYADTGLLLFPEVANYIVVVNIGEAPTDTTMQEFPFTVGPGQTLAPAFSGATLAYTISGLADMGTIAYDMSKAVGSTGAQVAAVYEYYSDADTKVETNVTGSGNLTVHASANSTNKVTITISDPDGVADDTVYVVNFQLA